MTLAKFLRGARRKELAVDFAPTSFLFSLILPPLYRAISQTENRNGNNDNSAQPLWGLLLLKTLVNPLCVDSEPTYCCLIDFQIFWSILVVTIFEFDQSVEFDNDFIIGSSAYYTFTESLDYKLEWCISQITWHPYILLFVRLQRTKRPILSYRFFETFLYAQVPSRINHSINRSKHENVLAYLKL